MDGVNTALWLREGGPNSDGWKESLALWILCAWATSKSFPPRICRISGILSVPYTSNTSKNVSTSPVPLNHPFSITVCSIGTFPLQGPCSGPLLSPSDHLLIVPYLKHGTKSCKVFSPCLIRIAYPFYKYFPYLGAIMLSHVWGLDDIWQLLLSHPQQLICNTYK